MTTDRRPRILAANGSASTIHTAQALRVYFTFGGAGNGSGICPTFLEGVGIKHRMRSRRPAPSRKVGGATNLKYTYTLR